MSNGLQRRRELSTPIQNPHCIPQSHYQQDKKTHTFLWDAIYFTFSSPGKIRPSCQKMPSTLSLSHFLSNVTPVFCRKLSILKAVGSIFAAKLTTVGEQIFFLPFFLQLRLRPLQSLVSTIL